MFKSTLLLAALVQLSPGQADLDAQSSVASVTRARSVATAVEYSGVARQLSVPAPVMASPDISIDGRLDDLAWETAAILTGFSQYQPVEGTAASEETMVRMIVTDDALYFAIRAQDAERWPACHADPAGWLRALGRLCTRVILDTFNDQRRAYVFMVNPYGIQGDGLWVEGGGGRFGDPIDWSPDFLWESYGRVDDCRLLRRDQDPAEDAALPEGRRAGLGSPDPAHDPAYRVRVVLGPDHSGAREQAGAGRLPHRTSRARCRAVHGDQPDPRRFADRGVCDRTGAASPATVVRERSA